MYFPFMMDVGDKSIVVIGGGTVALRKCELFLRFGAEITVIAPEICEELETLEGIQIIRQSYDRVQLDNAFAVIAATDDRSVNRAVSEYCKTRRIPVNVVDDPELCSFIVPSTVQRGALILGICTSGKSPSLAARLRRELEEQYDESYAERLELLGMLRERVLESGMEAKDRVTLLKQAAALKPEAIQELLDHMKESI